MILLLSYRRFWKYFFDRLAALMLLIILSPIILFIAILLFMAGGRNPFFTQLRPGLNGRVFTIYKFRTMNSLKDSSNQLLSDAKRLTYLGRIIRKTSLDELPQLLNVMIGDMSLIGPRPLLVEYLEIYDAFQMRRHEVLPGLTGWAQVNGRNSLQWNEKFVLDVWYVDNISVLLDLKICWYTLIKIVRRVGINSLNSATIERFKKMG